MITRLATRLGLALLTLQLAACAASNARSSYSCPAPDGVSCMSPSEVYEATHQGRGLQPQRGAAPATRTEPTLVLEGESLTLAPTATPTAFYPVENPPQAVPIRSASAVLRIWVAPYEDDAGDLVMAGHMFTEIQPRRWSVGERAPAELVVLQPLQVRTPVATPTSTTASAPHRALTLDAPARQSP